MQNSAKTVRNGNTFRICETTVYLIGDANVGKRTIKVLLEHSIRIFAEFLNNSAEGFSVRDVDKVVRFVIPAGPDLTAVLDSRSSIVLLYIYDICDPNSLANAVSACKCHQVDSLGPLPQIRDAVRCLVGNKIDMEFWRRVAVMDGINASKASNSSFVEISGHSGQHVDFLMDVVVRACFVQLADPASAMNVLTTVQKLQDRKLDVEGILHELKNRQDRLSANLNELDSSVYSSRKKRGITDLRKQSNLPSGRGKRDQGPSIPSLPPPLPASPPAAAAPLPELPLASMPAPLTRSPQLQGVPQAPVIGTSEGLELAHWPDSNRDYEVFPSSQYDSSALSLEIEMEIEIESDIIDDEDDEEPSPSLQPSSGLNRLSESAHGRDSLTDPISSLREKVAFKEDLTALKEDKRLPSRPPKDAVEKSKRKRRSEESARDVEEDVEEDLDYIKNIMHDNIDIVLDRSERIEELTLHAAELELHAATFHRNDNAIKGRLMCRNCCRCLFLCICGCPIGTVQFLYNNIKTILSKKALFDNVLADTENAFQALAKCLAALEEAGGKARSNLQNILFGYLLRAACLLSSFMLVLSSAITLILPSFFTLLIVRTGTIEKESKAFGVRQEVIRAEKKEDSFVRWVRIIFRSLPMTFYLLILPYLLVYYVFPSAGEQQLTLVLVIYLVGVILLQVLGSVRSYYSWKARDVKPPTPPTLYKVVHDKTLPRKTKCCGLTCLSCCTYSESGDDVQKTHIEKTTQPAAPNSFDVRKPGNWIELASLSLEFFQMASFALQRNPYISSNDDDENLPSPAPTVSPSAGVESAPAVGDDDTDFWGTKLFEALFVNLPAESCIQLGVMWSAVSLVGLLIVIFSAQFLAELKVYGKLMRDLKDKDKAKDAFFFSFTGAIVYGHGSPTNISDRMRLLVGLLSDGLFLVISVQLLNVFACDYDDNDKPTLRADDSVTCWEGHHAMLATASLVAYAFYVPLSIMITPMLLEAPRKDGDPGGNVTYLKLYLMSINVTKSVMLIVTVLGPQRISTAVISSIVASFLLGTLTFAWFKSRDLLSSDYSAELQPCNIAFINFWKAASYTTAVASAVILVTAHALQEDNFAPKALTEVLVVTWSLIAVMFAVFYFRYQKELSPRQTIVKELVAYPFLIRDLKESFVGGVELPPPPIVIFNEGSLFMQQNYRIPGFVESPWRDRKPSLSKTDRSVYVEDTGGVGSLSGAVIRYQIQRRFSLEK